MSRYLSISTGLGIFIAFAYTILNNTLNAPSFDDYDATILFIKNFYFDGYTLWEKITALFRTHNEHRIFLSRVFATVYYYFFQVINFRHLVFLQNFFLLATFGLCLRIMLKNNLPFHFAFLLLCITLFNLSFYQVSIYYWGGIQYYTVFFFSILSLFFLDKSIKAWSLSFVIAILAAILAIICFGNGFIVWGLGGFLLWSQKKFRLLYVWIFFSICLFLILFGPASKVQNSPLGAINFEWMARLLFTFIGSFVFVNPEGIPARYANIIICALVGIPIFVFWVVLFFRGFAVKNPLLYTLFCLPLLTAIVIAVARFNSKAAGGTASRYMFFTALIPVFLTLILWKMQKIKPKHLNGISVASVLIWLTSFYFNGKELRESNADVTDRIRRWEHNHEVQLVYYKESEYMTYYMDWAISHKVLPSVEKMTTGQPILVNNQ